MRKCVDIGGFGRSWTFASALVEAIRVSGNLKAEAAIFWPLRLIIKVVVRPSCITVKKTMVQEKQEI